MNRIMKVGVAALAIAAMVPAFANEEEVEDQRDEVVGWTPVALGLATPVQVPWGLNRWDVFGLDLNVFYADAPKMYGIDIGGLATTTRNDLIGLDVSGLLNLACQDVYGLRATLGVNFHGQGVYGMDAGLLSFGDKLCGLGVHFLGSAQHNMCGCQIGGLACVSSVESYGASIAGICNLARTAYGLQLALLYNMTEDLHGAQIGLVNYTRLCPGGFQIGLINIIRENCWPVLPIVNASF